MGGTTLIFFDFSELLIRLELTGADAPVGLYLHSSQTLLWQRRALEVASYAYLKFKTRNLTIRLNPSL